jgi:hypothetical protein
VGEAETEAEAVGEGVAVGLVEVVDEEAAMAGGGGVEVHPG